MFHPVGSRPSSVYWRRRLMLVAVLVAALVLLVLTLKTLTSDGSTPVAGPGSSHPGSSHQAVPPSTNTSSTSAPPTDPATSQSRTRSAASSSTGTSTTPSGSGSVVPADCTSGQLKVQASTDKKSYAVGDEPVLSMLITNTGPQPCVQNLADSQIVLSVYNGAARVWGSHDCQIQPGTDDRTLVVNAPVKVNIPWSGLTSQPNCAGTRQRVGAGTYTLYPTLSGTKGVAAQFAIH